ncbi:MAG TPA: class I SAM-dependent methyltransferase [Burkholderiales bacterium]|nr:class I SAM-dependent methyltransferase [Burkholderiales bacterium]
MIEQAARVTKQVLRSPGVYRAARAAARAVLSRLYARDLTMLAVLHGTDKWGSHHWYTPHYEAQFRALRTKRLKILEIGVGGYADPAAGGESLRMWKYYFPRSQIYALDLYDKSPLEEPRIRIFRGSQDDPACLRRVAEEMGRIDIVIDDGSHVNAHVITSFRTLFPLLEPGGVYAVEDTQTTYWPAYGGDSYELSSPKTMLGFLKSLADAVNYQELARRGYEPTYFDRNVTAVHFYHNLVFVTKGANEEPGGGLAAKHLY